MPPTSSYLNDILDRWNTRGRDLRQEVVFQIDLINPQALAAIGNRLTLRERYRHDIQQLDQWAQDAQARWDERLHRIEEWQNSAKVSQAQAEQNQGIIHSILWLDNARAHLDTFTQRLNRRGERLFQEQQNLHLKLEFWSDVLQIREQQLHELLQREVQSNEPLYVSRARKQPEIDFVNEQRAVNETLGKEMQELRSSLTLTRGRLQKALSALEHRTTTPQILYAVRKQEIETGLKASEKALQEVRTYILSDALVYEACRSSLRRSQEMVKSLRCIEDLPRTSKISWKNFFS